MDWLKIALNGLQIGSILATAGFAAFGLVSKFKDDHGKLTKAGRIALAGIGLSALLSLTTQSVKAENDRRSAAKADWIHHMELGNELVLFEAQSRALSGLDQKQRDVFDQTGTVLRNLKDVGAEVGESVRSIDLVGRKQDVHTARMLRTMWEDANRITSNSVQLLVGYKCPIKPGAELPSLLGDHAVAFVGFGTRAQVAALRDPLDSLQDDTMFETGLEALPQRVLVQPGLSNNEVVHATTFGPFIVENGGVMADPANWRGAGVDAFLFSPLPVSVDQLKAILGEEFRNEETLSRKYTMWNHTYDTVAGVLPCDADVTLLVNGRETMNDEVPLLLIWRGFSDQPFVALKVPVHIVDPKAFPTFEMASQGAGRR